MSESAEEPKVRYGGALDGYQYGHTIKGGAYDTIFGYFHYTCCQFKGGLDPAKSDNAVGFRVVRGSKVNK